MSVLDVLLEGFDDAKHPAAEFGGRFERNDRVRVPVKGKSSVVGRLLRVSAADPRKVVVAPDGAAPHIEAELASVSLDTPARHAQHRERQQREQAQQAALSFGKPVQAPLARGGQAPPARGAAPPARGATATTARAARGSSLGAAGAAPRVQEGVSVLLEAFTAPAPTPSETPGQSMRIGAQQQKAAQQTIASGAWNPSKHPRARGGKFGYTTGGKRAKKPRVAHGGAASSRSHPNVLKVGTSGALVRAIQKQLRIPTDGQYGPQTRAAVLRFQQQHGLQADGEVGRQTLAALRGNPNARKVAPGSIPVKAARVVSPRARKVRQPRAPVRTGAPVRAAGGLLVR